MAVKRNSLLMACFQLVGDAAVGGSILKRLRQQQINRYGGYLVGYDVRERRSLEWLQLHSLWSRGELRKLYLLSERKSHAGSVFYSPRFAHETK